MSLGRQVRDAIEAWAAGLSLSGLDATRINSEPPVATAVDRSVSLPRLSFWMPAERELWRADMHDPAATDGNTQTYALGEVEADCLIVYQAASYAGAETFREEFRKLAVLPAIKADDNGEPVVRLSETLQGVASQEIRLYFETSVAVYNLDESQRQDLWRVRREATVTWPILEEEAADAGVQDIVVDLELPEGREAPPDTFDMNDYQP